MNNISFVFGLIIFLTSTLSETKKNETSSDKLTNGTNARSNKVGEENIIKKFNLSGNKSETNYEKPAKNNSSKNRNEKVPKFQETHSSTNQSAANENEIIENQTNQNETIGSKTIQNETNRVETNPNETKRVETNQNETIGNKTNQNETNSVETNQNETVGSKTIQNETNQNETTSKSSTQNSTRKKVAIKVENHLKRKEDDELIKKAIEKKDETKKKKDKQKTNYDSTVSNNRTTQTKREEPRAEFVEEVEFVNISDFRIDETNVGPPLEDSEVDLLPKGFLSKFQNDDESMDVDENRQKIVPVFGGGSRNGMGSKNRGAKSDPRYKWPNCQVRL